MIQLYDAKYYDFSEQLKVHIEDKLKGLLQFCKNYFESSTLPYKSNFSTYIRKTDYFNSHKSKDYFIIELDNYTLLDLYAYYNKNEDKMYDFSFKSIVYMHENWNADNFHDIKLSDEERESFLSLQNQFYKNIESIGMMGIVTIPEFNPDRDTLPESVVEFQHKTKSMEELLEDTDILEKFFDYYYQYAYTVRKKFTELTAHIS